MHRFRVRVRDGYGEISCTRGPKYRRLPLTREKRVGYREEWLRQYHIWEIMVAFYTELRGKHVRLPVLVG